jgi:NADH-quinone oxidoreductase subunit C
MSYKNVIQTIHKKFPDAVVKETVNKGQREITLAKGQFYEAMRVLQDNPDLPYDLLIDILGIDHTPRTPRFDLVYILLSTKDFSRLIVRLQAEEGEEIPSVSSIWHSANWGEREVYDLMGIPFSDHPDLKRILTWKNFEGHPLRKDFPLEGKDFDKPFDPETIEDYP